MDASPGRDTVLPSDRRTAPEPDVRPVPDVLDLFQGRERATGAERASAGATSVSEDTPLSDSALPLRLPDASPGEVPFPPSDWLALGDSSLLDLALGEPDLKNAPFDLEAPDLTSALGLPPLEAPRPPSVVLASSRESVASSPASVAAAGPRLETPAMEDDGFDGLEPLAFE